jgi:hypothetical protein
MDEASLLASQSGRDLRSSEIPHPQWEFSFSDPNDEGMILRFGVRFENSGLEFSRAK